MINRVLQISILALLIPSAFQNSVNNPGSVPAGLVTFVSSGGCPAGWVELPSLANVILRGTTTGAGNIGMTGGSDTITPTTSSIALTAAAQAFNGSPTTVPAETVNTLTAAAQTVSYPVNVPNFSGSPVALSGVTAAAQIFSGSTGTVAAQTFAGSATTVPALAAGTLTATAQAFVGSSASVSGTSGTESAHTHSVTSNVTGTLTPAGTIAWPMQVPTNASGAFSEGTISWPAGVPTHSGTAASFAGNLVTAASTTSGAKLVTANTSTGVSPQTQATGTVTITSQGTIAWPAVGVPAIAGGSFTQPTISWPDGVPAFSGTANQSLTMTDNAVTSGAGSSHSHGAGSYVVTATGTNGSSAVSGSTATGTLTPLGSNASVAFTPAGVNASSAVSGNATAAGTIEWPMNPPTNGTSAVTGTLNSTTVTPLGANGASSVAGTIGMNSFDNRPAYINVIFCQKA